MSFFSKKKTIELQSELQKDTLIDMLEQAHVDYDVRERLDTDLCKEKVTYLISFDPAALHKAA